MEGYYKHELELEIEDDFARDHYVYVEFNNELDFEISNATYLWDYFDLNDVDLIDSIQDSILEYLQQLPADEACKAYDFNN